MNNSGGNSISVVHDHGHHLNFHKDLMVRRGYGDTAARTQDLYLTGRKEAAMAAVPDEFCDEGALVGPFPRIRERYRAWADWREANISTLRRRLPRPWPPSP